MDGNLTDAQKDWARCRPWIETALATNPFYNIEWVEAEISRGEMMFWAGAHGAVLTDIEELPNGRALNVFAVGGEPNKALDELLSEFLPELEAYGKARECKWVIGGGRSGWLAVGKKEGFRPVWHVMAKDLA